MNPLVGKNALTLEDISEKGYLVPAATNCPIAENTCAVSQLLERPQKFSV